MQLHGIDFTSAPTTRKPITVATGVLNGDCLQLHRLTCMHDFPAFEAWLQLPGPWLGVFDMPFSLPRELIETLGWPTQWPAMMREFAGLTRAEMRMLFKAFCDARPVGSKFAHRATDRPAGSSSSMKWVNPPVAYMLHAGVPRLLDAGLTLVGMQAGDPSRLAFEGYPGMVARALVKGSYKNDDLKKQTSARRDNRVAMIERLESGDHRFAIRLDAGKHRDALIEDGSADLLDAALCAILAAWAWQRRDAQYGLPAFDPLEGWIVGA